MSRIQRNLLISPLVFLGVPVTLLARGVEWSATRVARAAHWLSEAMPRWEP